MSRLRPAAALTVLALISACGNLPDDGPTVRAIKKGAVAPATDRYALVDIDSRVIRVLAAHPPAPLATLAPASSEAPNDLIAVGDVLQVGIYQPGVGAIVSAAPQPS
ncbi:MAG: polysaccharide biosynthesis/export family protein, partial [Caulobacteraceae bacterium]